MIRLTLVDMKQLPQVLGLFKSAAERIDRMNVDHWQYWNNPPPDKVDWVIEGINKGEFYFILHSELERIGMLRIMDEDLLYWGVQAERAKYIHSLVIEEQFNGFGLGKIVLNEIERWAEIERCSYLRLDADISNSNLCRYYSNLGFKESGVIKLQNGIYQLFEKEITSNR
jgi:GNAT superfamily N-acetyltransferase